MSANVRDRLAGAGAGKKAEGQAVVRSISTGNSSSETSNGSAARRRKLKQAMLATLGRDQLKTLVDDLELDADRRSVDQMRQVLSRSHRVTPEYLAGSLYETAAKAVCESLQIDSKGRRQTIVQRLLEWAEGTAAEPPALPKRERDAIAHILGTLDDKIELNRRMNATLEALARALFNSWFVDFDPVRAKMDGRQPAGMDAETARLFPDRLEHTGLGLVPKGWRYCHLEETLSTLETGSRPKGGVSGITSGIPSVGAESIVGIGQFNFEKTKYVPFDFYHAMRRGHVESRDVLLYKDGGRPGEYEPHVSMFGDGFPFPQLCINEHVYRLRGNDMAGQAYLYLWLTTDGLLEEMRMKGTGVAIPGLNSTAVKSLTILVPTQDVMGLLESTLGFFVGRILSNSKQSQSLASLRDTLLPKLLSGELRVPEAERQLESSP